MTKPILCLDFDGVIHSYTSGWKGADVIPDPPVPGAIEFIFRALPHFTVAIYSSRSGQEGGIDAMREWLLDWIKQTDFKPGDWTTPGTLGEAFYAIQWPTEKPPAMVSRKVMPVTSSCSEVVMVKVLGGVQGGSGQGGQHHRVRMPGPEEQDDSAHGLRPPSAPAPRTRG